MRRAPCPRIHAQICVIQIGWESGILCTSQQLGVSALLEIVIEVKFDILSVLPAHSGNMRSVLRTLRPKCSISTGNGGVYRKLYFLDSSCPRWRWNTLRVLPVLNVSINRSAWFHTNITQHHGADVVTSQRSEGCTGDYWSYLNIGGALFNDNGSWSHSRNSCFCSMVSVPISRACMTNTVRSRESHIVVT